MKKSLTILTFFSIFYKNFPQNEWLMCALRSHINLTLNNNNNNNNNIYIYICGDQLYPVLKPRWKRPGPISDLICTSCVRRGQAQCPIWGWENIWGQSTKEEIRFSSEERWRTLVGIWPCPRTIVTSGLLSEVFGELISHLE